MMRFKLLLALLTCGLLLGCGGSDKPPAYANVSGTVNFDGKPLSKGVITFYTDGRPPVPMDIADGKFNGQAMVGPNKITVSAKQKSSKASAIPAHGIEQMKMAEAQANGGKPVEMDYNMQEMIPADWNTTSKQSRVIEPGSGNNFEFNIKSK